MNIALLNPAALWALAALAIPLVIHLLHRGQRQRIMVGSVRFLKGRETQTLSRIKLTEKRLLLLRMLLLALLALLLAQPHWRVAKSQKAPAGWLLLDPRIAETDLPEAQARLLERARDQAWRQSWLATDFPDISSKAEGLASSEPGEIWSLVAEAAMALPADRPLTVITSDHLEDYQGVKPELKHNKLSWHLVPRRVHSVALEYGYLLKPDRLMLVVGQYVEGHWQRSRHFVAWDGQSRTQRLNGLTLSGEVEPELSLRLQGDRIQVQLGEGSGDGLAISPDVPNMRVAIITSQPTDQDVAFIQLGLQTIADFYQWPLEVSVYPGTELPSTPPALAFFLGTDKVNPPPDWYAEGTWVIGDAGNARFGTMGRSIDWGSDYPGPPAKLMRRVAPLLRGEVLWHDAWGVPVLEMEPIQNGRRYQFASRFLPEWSDLVFHEAFPLILADLMESNWLDKQRPNQKTLDGRMISPAQAKPRLGGNLVQKSDVVLTSLALPVWLALMVVFVLERWWRFRRQAQ